MTPEEFLAINDKDQYQYFVAFSIDRALRKHVVELIESEDLDCITFIHPTSMCYASDITGIVGHGTIVGPFNSILIHSTIGNHCIVEAYCLVAHYVNLSDNVHLHPGVLIAGRTQIGSNSVFNLRSSTINGLTLCGDIEVGASSTVTKNLDRAGKYVGTPARYIGPVKESNNV
jgi:serine acetyltransferase